MKFGALAFASAIVEDDAVDPEDEEEDAVGAEEEVEDAVLSSVLGEVVTSPPES